VRKKRKKKGRKQRERARKQRSHADLVLCPFLLFFFFSSSFWAFFQEGCGGGGVWCDPRRAVGVAAAPAVDQSDVLWVVWRGLNDLLASPVGTVVLAVCLQTPQCGPYLSLPPSLPPLSVSVGGGCFEVSLLCLCLLFYGWAWRQGVPFGCCQLAPTSTVDTTLSGGAASQPGGARGEVYPGSLVLLGAGRPLLAG